jgi:4-hydroxy-3-methylbut-2-enyl diphosphate reductase
VDDYRDVNPEWLEDVETVVVTAGASAPENLVEELVESLVRNGYRHREQIEVKREDVRFSLPAGLNPPVLTQIAV